MEVVVVVRSDKHIFRRDRNRFAIGFTLMELIVVLGIMAMLFALLLPTMTKIRQVATTVSCIARMKQLNLATLTFATNNGGHFPPIFAGSSQNGANTYTFPWGWPKAIFPNDVSTPARALATGYLTSYFSPGIKDYKLYLCPSLESNLSYSTQGNRSYMYNRYLGGEPSNWWALPGTSTSWRACAPWKISAVQDPSTMSIFLCTGGVSSGMGNSGNQLWFRNDPAAETGAYNSPKAYHLPGGSGGIMIHQAIIPGGTFTGWWGGQTPKYRGLVNIAFVDGSVRSIEWTGDRYPTLAIEGVRVRPEYLTLTW